MDQNGSEILILLLQHFLQKFQLWVVMDKWNFPIYTASQTQLMILKGKSDKFGGNIWLDCLCRGRAGSGNSVKLLQISILNWCGQCRCYYHTAG